MPVPGFMGIVRGIQSQVSGWPQVRSIIGNRAFATSALLFYFPVQLPKGFGTVFQPYSVSIGLPRIFNQLVDQ